MTAFSHGTPVFLTDEIRRIEAAHAGEPLMERAGLAAAELARELAGGSGKPIVLFAGPGNNGGDAFVAARHLRSWWFDVRVVFTGDADKLPQDATAAYRAWREAGGNEVTAAPAGEHALLVDGLFGIGLRRDLEGDYASIVSWINSADAPVLALDVPSGLESDCGRVLGCAVRADRTITFIGLKAGLLTLDGPDHCGELSVASIGVDVARPPPTGSTVGAESLLALPPRLLNSHKGTFGSVGIVGGATGMVGAALLAGRAALRLGAGRVYVGLLDHARFPVDPVQPELMLRPAAEVVALDQLTAVAVGPGLGTSADAAAVLRDTLATALPLVLDADALNLVATHPALRAALTKRQGPTILTPHPAEAARLLGCGTADVQRDRVAAARKLAETYRCAVVLKGAGSVCASPDGAWAINTSGNPGMATAGMGDVLTGMIASLLAQAVPPHQALTAGVYLHGAAADSLVDTGVGPAGLTASEVADEARELANQFRAA